MLMATNVYCLYVCVDKLQRLVDRWRRCLVENKAQWRQRALNGTTTT